MSDIPIPAKLLNAIDYHHLTVMEGEETPPPKRNWNKEPKYIPNTIVRKGLVSLLNKFSHLQASDNYDVGCFDLPGFEMRLELKPDAKPYAEKFRKGNYKWLKEIETEVRELEKRNLIRKSHSPWASNLHCVSAPGKRLRICVDYRKLNQMLKFDEWSIPKISDLVSRFRGKKVFTLLDIRRAFWNVR